MQSKQRYLLALIFTGVLALLFLLQMLKVQRDNAEMTLHEQRFVLSSALMVERDTNHEVLYDGKLETALKNINHLGAVPGAEFPAGDSDGQDWDFPLQRPFLQINIGLSHFPHKPPLKNPVYGMRIWTGNQQSAASYQQYARPRRIRLLFFRQGLVDSDREYRFVDNPVFWQSIEMQLPDFAGAIEIPLNFKTGMQESPAFPTNMEMLWCRLEVLSYYPGLKINETRPAGEIPDAHRIAISELEFFQTRAVRPLIQSAGPCRRLDGSVCKFSKENAPQI